MAAVAMGITEEAVAIDQDIMVAAAAVGIPGAKLARTQHRLVLDLAAAVLVDHFRQLVRARMQEAIMDKNHEGDL